MTTAINEPRRIASSRAPGAGRVKASALSIGGRSLIPRVLVIKVALAAGAIVFFVGERP
jgi:hypothetical protein